MSLPCAAMPVTWKARRNSCHVRAACTHITRTRLADEYNCDYVMLVCAGCKPVLLHPVAIFLALFCIYTIVVPMTGSRAYHAPADQAEAQTTAIVNASKSFLALLDEQSLMGILLPYEAQDRGKPVYFPHPKRPDFNFVGGKYGQSIWSNFPVSDVPRPGLRLGELSASQYDAAMRILQVSLSDRGYRKVQDIIESDQTHANSGVPYAAGQAAYTLGFFGDPSLTNLWMFQIGGHHLALNLAISGPQAVLAPVLTGALPATYLKDDVQRRALAYENDKAFALHATLDHAQREKILIDHPVSELSFGPGDDGKLILPLGLRGSLLSAKQRTMLLDLISEWVCIINDVHSAPRLDEIRAGLDDTFFAWSGPSTCEPGRNGASYFRIQGPNLLIEFSPQFPGGDLTMHVHTIYRDPLRAYGRRLVSKST